MCAPYFCAAFASIHCVYVALMYLYALYVLGTFTSAHGIIERKMMEKLEIDT